MSVTVYSKPACVQCTATYRALDRLGVDYDIVDISEDAEALDRVRGMGYMQFLSSLPASSIGRGFVRT